MNDENKILRAIMSARAYARQRDDADLLAAADRALSTALKEISSVRLNEARTLTAQGESGK